MATFVSSWSDLDACVDDVQNGTASRRIWDVAHWNTFLRAKGATEAATAAPGGEVGCWDRRGIPGGSLGSESLACVFLWRIREERQSAGRPMSVESGRTAELGNRKGKARFPALGRRRSGA